MGTLYLVATPIGNLDDISARALHTLANVNVIAAEDTRHTRKLLNHFSIDKKTISYHEHNKLSRLDEVLAYLATGDVALVSDAGTPTINDPGYELVRAVLDAGHEVTPIPGASAPIVALSASGLPTDAFLYLGYLPRKNKARLNMLKEAAVYPFTLIFLETPHRLLDSLQAIAEVFGPRQIAVARELTKKFEEIYRGSIPNAIEHFTHKAPRGEFTLVVAGAHRTDAQTWSEEEVRTAIQTHLQDGMSPSRVVKVLTADTGWKKKTLYALVNEITANN